MFDLRGGSIERMNRRDRSTEPGGTPCVPGVVWDLQLLMEMSWTLSERLGLNQESYAWLQTSEEDGVVAGVEGVTKVEQESEERRRHCNVLWWVQKLTWNASHNWLEWKYGLSQIAADWEMRGLYLSWYWIYVCQGGGIIVLRHGTRQPRLLWVHP